MTEEPRLNTFRVAAGYGNEGEFVESAAEGREGWLSLRAQYPNMHVWPCNASRDSWLNGGVVIYCDSDVSEDIALAYSLEIRKKRSHDSSPNRFYMRVPCDTYIPDLVKVLEADTRITQVYEDRSLVVKR